MKLDEYERWLRKEGYQPTTIEVTLRHIRAARSDSARLPRHRVPHVRRYLRFVAKTRKNPLGRSFAKRMLDDYGLTPAGEIEKQGSRDRETLTQKQWDALKQKLRGGDRISRLLVAYMESPYRIGDFLNLKASGVTPDDVSDKVSRDWVRRFGGKKKLYQMLCTTERCAYYRLRRRLQKINQKLKTDPDLDTLYKSFHELNGEEAA